MNARALAVSALVGAIVAVGLYKGLAWDRATTAAYLEHGATL